MKSRKMPNWFAGSPLDEKADRAEGYGLLSEASELLTGLMGVRLTLSGSG